MLSLICFLVILNHSYRSLSSYKKAIEKGASRLIIAHNHPSGDTIPSDADISLTKTLLEGGKILNIPILDHIIVSKGTFESIRQTSNHLWNSE